MKKIIGQINTFAHNYGGVLTVIGLVLTVGAIIYSVYVSKQTVEAGNIPKKELTCILNYSQKLITKNTSDNDFKVFYKDTEISDPYIFSITIQNTGDFAITNDDFKSDFSIYLINCNRIINASVVQSTNQAITDEVLTNSIYSNNAFSVSDFFLNPGESFTVHIISDGKPQTIRYTARIEDIPKLLLRDIKAEKIDTLKKQRSTFLTIIFIVIIAVLGWLLTWALVDRKKIKKALLKYKEDMTNA